MADWKALCQELVDSIELLLEMRPADARPLSITEERYARARAALAAKADGPAVPEGREPASVVGEPSDEEPAQAAIDTRLYRFQATAGDPVQYELTEAQINAFARAVLDRFGRQPAPPAAGEVGELVAALRIESSRCTCTLLTTDDLRRAADLLDELVQVAYAASDFICGTHFPEFANEHGGIDRLTADLRRLVAQFEYGPRPVPGVDVPGPDGDWGGLEELCKAEGVDLRIGVPLLQRAQEAWKNASQATPAPVGMIPVEYCDLDSGARIVSEPSEEGPGGCWVVLNSRHVSPLTEFPTAEAAWNALQAAHALPLPSGEVE